jgi:SNF2 family DNA or RNA helicase
MLSREKDTQLPPYWRYNVLENEYQSTLFAGVSSSHRPLCIKGGILADDMGMGKSMQTISCIVAHTASGEIPVAGALKEENAYLVGIKKDLEKKTTLELVQEWEEICASVIRPNIGERNDDDEVSEEEDDEDVFTSKKRKRVKEQQKKKKLKGAQAKNQLTRKALVHLIGHYRTVDFHDTFRDFITAFKSGRHTPKGTLVVCPAIVVDVWVNEIKKHTAKDTLRVYAYRGTERIRDAAFLSYFDVVVCSYSTMFNDFKYDGLKRLIKRGDGVAEVDWFRVVLDEMHMARNSRTKSAKAIAMLEGKIRWGLTGTPLVNYSTDYFSYLSFLRYAPGNDQAIYTVHIKRKIGHTDAGTHEQGLRNLRNLIGPISLRREKDLLKDFLKPFKMFEKDNAICMMSEVQKEVYECIYESCRSLLSILITKKKWLKEMMTKMMHIFEVILRLRQCCDSHHLIPAERLGLSRYVLSQINKEGQELDPKEALRLLQLFGKGKKKEGNAARRQDDDADDDDDDDDGDDLKDFIVNDSDEDEDDSEDEVAEEHGRHRKKRQQLVCGSCKLDIRGEMFAGDPCKCKICNVCCDDLYKSGSKRCPVCRADTAQFVGKNDVEFLKVVAGVETSSGDEEEFKNGLKGRLNDINREHKKLIKSMDWSPKGGNVPPKIDSTIKQLRRMRQQDPSSKAVIFSQVSLLQSPF